MIDKNQIRNLFNQRKKLRKEKKFPEADEIRRKIESMGYIVTDWESETKFELKNIFCLLFSYSNSPHDHIIPKLTSN